MQGIFSKLFMSGEWNIAIRENKDTPFFDYQRDFKSLPRDKRYWFADPMIVKYNNRSVLFCEGFERKKQIGTLGYFELTNGMMSNYRVVLNNNYHMSYPCVFLYNDELYMIPESEEHKCLELYHCKHFPEQWEKKDSLIDNVTLADPTVFMHDGNLMIIAMDTSQVKYYLNNIYRFDLESKRITLTGQLKSKNNDIRPAGYVFESDNRI